MGLPKPEPKHKLDGETAADARARREEYVDNLRRLREEHGDSALADAIIQRNTCQGTSQTN